MKPLMSSMSLWWTTRLFSLVSSWLLCPDVNATINSAVNAGAPLNGWNAPNETLNEPFEYSIMFDTTTNLNVAEDRSTESSKDKVLLFEDATTNWNVEEDWSTKDKGMSKLDRHCQEWSIEHDKGNLRSTISIHHCHLIKWDFAWSGSIRHCHKSIDILLTNVWHCRKWFAEDLVFDGSWILLGCFASCSCSLHVTCSDFLSW